MIKNLRYGIKANKKFLKMLPEMIKGDEDEFDLSIKAEFENLIVELEKAVKRIQEDNLTEEYKFVKKYNEKMISIFQDRISIIERFLKGRYGNGTKTDQ